MENVFKHKEVMKKREQEREISQFKREQIDQFANGYTEILGRGSYGKVFKGNTGNNDVALKIYLREPTSEEHYRPTSEEHYRPTSEEHYRVEKDHLSKFCHPHIVKCAGYCEDVNFCVLVVEYVPRVLSKVYNDLKWKDVIKILTQVASALEHVHQHGEKSLVYADLKPSNILLDNNNDAKLCDFGSISDGKKGSNTYTVAYVAPEYLIGDYDQRADIYSYGILMLQLLTKEGEKDLGQTKNRKHFLAKGRKHSIAKRKQPKVEETIVERVRKKTSIHQQIVHSSLLESGCAQESADFIVQLALDCTSYYMRPRPPTIDAVLAKFKKLEQLEREKEEQKEQDQNQRQMGQKKNKGTMKMRKQ